MKQRIVSLIIILTIIFAAAPLYGTKTHAATVLDVTKYGATGNDKTDDTDAFQKAMDAANSASGTVTVFVPAGTYYIGAPSGKSQRAVWIYSNTTLELADGAMLISNAPEKYILEASGQSNVAITGGIFDGNVTNTAIAQGLVAMSVMKTVNITGTTFRNYCGTHAVVMDGVQNLKVSNCRFENFKLFTGSAAQYEAQTSSTSYWSGEALHIDFIAPDGSDKGSNIKNIEVCDCVFERVPTGVGTHHVYDTLTADNIKIHDNTFINCLYDACNASNFKNFEFYNNMAENTPALINAMNIRGNIYNNILDNSAFKPSASELKNIYAFGRNYLDLGSLSAIELVNDHDASGINYTNSTDVSVYDNEIHVGNYNNSSDCRICGIHSAYDAVVRASDNRIYNAPYRGIYINTGKAYLTGNMINKSYDAIYVSDIAAPEVSENIILDTTQRGIVVNESSNASVKNNYINKTSLDSNGRGIVFQKCSGKNTASGNTVLHTKDWGIYAYGSVMGDISGNTVGFCSNHAIVLNTGSKAGAISRNYFFNNNDNYDLYVTGSSSADGFYSNTSDWSLVTRSSAMVNAGSSCSVYRNEYIKFNFEKMNTQPASCSECGFTEYLSKNTQFRYKELTAMTEHSWDSGSVVRQATASLAGQIRYTCTKDGSHSVERALTYRASDPPKQAAAQTGEFSDVQKGMVADSVYKCIYWGVDKGIIKGYNDNTFRPANSCTRSQFVTMLWRMAGRPDPGNAPGFNDVDSTMSAYRAIRWAAAQGIVQGYKDGTFRPSAPLTRSQIVTIIWRMQGRPAAGSNAKNFPDVANSLSAATAIRWASSHSVVNGYSNGNFGPADNCTRSQILTILYRCVEKQGYLTIK